MLVGLEKIQQAKEKLGARNADIIAELFQVEKWDARNHKGLCPFHREDTPSFIYNPKTYKAKCFRGDTGVVTSRGVFPIESLAGRRVEVINGLGEWEQTQFHYCGNQKIYELHILSRGKSSVIYTTKEHEWIVQECKKKITTNNLKPGHHLKKMWAKHPKEGLKYDYIRGDSSFFSATVTKVVETNEIAPVYCCETSTKSFVLKNFILTGNCFGCGKVVDVLDAYVASGKTYMGAVQALFDEAGVHYAFGELGVKTRAQYRYPKEVPLNEKNNVYDYLGRRCISKKTIDGADVREDAHGNIVFNYYDTNDVLCLVKYRPSHKVNKSNGELKVWCQKDADTTPLLFNMNRVNTSQPLLITEGECVLGDSEVLTPNGWVRLEKYGNEQVLQINPDLTGDFVTPLAYVKHGYDGELYIDRKKNFSSITTANHNIVYVDDKGCLQKKRKACEMPNIGSGYIPTAITVNGGGIPLTNDQIALYLAISADCTIDVRKTTRHSRFSIKKERKYTRLKNILERLNIPYFDNKNAGKSYKYIGFKTPDWVVSKTLPWEWVGQATAEQRKFIIEEMTHWGGNRVKTKKQYEYSTKEYDNAVFIQTIAHTCGYTSTVIPRHNIHGSWYKVSVLLSESHISHQKPYKKEHYQGMVYCVTVPTGMILMRQEGHVFVTGNCDCLAAIEAGYSNAVSVPFGANNYGWIEENFDWLEQFESIIICADNDEAGTKMQKECVFRLGSWKTKFIEIPQIHIDPNGEKRTIKDLNEVLYYKGKQAVLDLIANAKDSPVDSVSDFSEITNIDLDDIDGVSTGISGLDKRLMKLFYGSFNIVTGVNGSGKSSFLSSIICNAIDSGQNAFLYSGELPNFQSKNWINYILAGQRHINQYQSNGATYWKVTNEAQKKINDFYKGRLFIYKDGYDHKVESLLKAMEDTTRKYGVKLHVIDNLTSVNLECNDNNKYQRQEEFVTKLIDFAKKFNVAVCLVVHPHKIETMRRLTKMDIQGISAIIDLAHRIISLYRVTQEDKNGIPKQAGGGWIKEPVKYDVLCDILKDRMLGCEGSSVGLFYDKPSRRFFENEEDLGKQYKWDTSKYDSELPYPPMQLYDMSEEVFGKIE